MMLPRRPRRAAVKALGQLLGQQGDLLAEVDVAGVEKPAGEHHQVAHRLVVFVGADDQQTSLLLAVDQHAVVVVHRCRWRRRCGRPAARARPARRPVLTKSASTSADDLLRADFVGREDHVRTHAFDLFQDVIAAGERDGDHQDDRGGADDHAESREERTHGIAAQGLEAETQRFAEVHALAARSLFQQFFGLGRGGSSGVNGAPDIASAACARSRCCGRARRKCLRARTSLWGALGASFSASRKFCSLS